MIKKSIKYAKCFLWIRHKPAYKNGKGYRCKYCNKMLSECR
jgi:hypothetical protein